MRTDRTGNILKGVVAIFIITISLQDVHAKQITDSGFYGYKPSLYDGTIAWCVYNDNGVSNKKEIYYYNGKDILQITDNILSKSRPKLHKGIITWEADNDIYYWDGMVHQLTDDDNSDSEPCVYNGKIVWISHQVGPDSPLEYRNDIFLWNGVSITQITDTNTLKYDLSYHNGGVVWSENDGTDYEIFYWNGAGITQITDNDFDDRNPQIHDNMVVWWGGDDSLSYEIYYWNGAIHQLTVDDVPDKNPSIYEGNIAWERTPWNGDSGIYYYDSETKVTKQIASLEEGGGGSPSLHQNQVACEGLDYHDLDTGADGYEIFLFDISIPDSTINSVGSGSSSGGGCFINSLLSFSGSE